MERSIEILQILRRGMETMLQDVDNSSVRYTRIFNFNERRVGLRMEVSERGQEFIPMGRIDVLEIPTNNGRVTCSCTLTELQTGNSQRDHSTPENVQGTGKECEKVFVFFRKVLALDQKPVSRVRRQKLLMQRNQQERVFHQFKRGSQAEPQGLAAKKIFWFNLGDLTNFFQFSKVDFFRVSNDGHENRLGLYLFLVKTSQIFDIGVLN